MRTENTLLATAFIFIINIIYSQDVPDIQYNLSASVILNTNPYLNLSVNIYPTQDYMSINMSGPIDKWFGVGFGNNIMTDTYAIICSQDSNSKNICQENKLGPEAATGYGSQLNSTITVLTDTINSNIRNIYLTRDITINDTSKDYFSFSTCTETIDVIYGIGDSNSFTSNCDSSCMGPGGSAKLKIANGLDNNLTVSNNTLSAQITLNSIVVYPDEDVVQLNISGPSDVWFGIGFNSTSMGPKTYVIVCDVIACHENFMTTVAYGAPLTSTTKIVYNSTINGTKTLLVNRKRNITQKDTNDYIKYFPFPTDAMNLSIIYAIGTGDTWNAETSMNLIDQTTYGSTEIEFKKPLTPYTIVARSPLFADVHQTVDIEIHPLDNKVNITLTGPDDKWFGIGFNTAVMGGGYSIVCSDETLCFEQLLGEGNVGQRFVQQHIQTVSDTKSNGVRTVKLTRKQIIDRNDDANYQFFYSFSSYDTKIPIIYAYGIDNKFTNQSAMGKDKVAALQFNNKANRFNLSAALNIFADVNQTVNINVFPDENNVEIVFTGPSDVWYGIGFNSTKMNNTYAIVVDTVNNAHEYILVANHSGNRLQKPNINFESNIVSNGIRTTKISRPLAILNEMGYDFPVSPLNLSIISAYGTNNPYNNSKMRNATIKMLPFELNLGDTPCKPGIKSYGTKHSLDNGFTIGLRIYCIDKTIELSIDYTNYAPNWFGIVFNNLMITSPNATIFTTGKPNEDQRPLGLYAYALDGKISSQVVYHKERDWKQLKQTIIGKTVSIVYSQNLNQTKWNIYTKEITFRYAWGTSHQATTLQQHTQTAKSTTYTFNLVTGALSTSGGSAIQTAHGIIMIISWSLLTTIGIFSSRYRLILYQKVKSKAMWFFVHRGIQCTVVVLVLISFGIAIYFTSDNDNEHFSNSHECVGLTVVIFAVLQPINAWFRPHPPKKNQSRSSSRLIWEIIHKSFGYITWIMAQIAIYLGIGELTDKTVYKTIFFVWLSIVFALFALLYIHNACCFIPPIQGMHNKGLIANESNKIIKPNNVITSTNALSPGSSIGPAIDYASDPETSN